MLAYILALTVGLGSFALYMAAFFLPEVHRKSDFYWSGVGLFYALVLWVCAGRITGGVLLGQLAGVSLLGWFGWQTLTLRRELVPSDQKTELSPEKVAALSPGGSLTGLKERVTGLFKKTKDQAQKTATQVGEQTQKAATQVSDRAQKTATQVSEQVKETTSQVSEQTQKAASQVSEQAQETTSQVSEQTQKAASQVSEQAQETTSQVSEQAQEMVNQVVPPASTLETDFESMDSVATVEVEENAIADDPLPPPVGIPTIEETIPMPETSAEVIEAPEIPESVSDTPELVRPNPPTAEMVEVAIASTPEDAPEASQPTVPIEDVIDEDDHHSK